MFAISLQIIRFPVIDLINVYTVFIISFHLTNSEKKFFYNFKLSKFICDTGLRKRFERARCTARIVVSPATPDKINLAI